MRLALQTLAVENRKEIEKKRLQLQGDNAGSGREDVARDTETEGEREFDYTKRMTKRIRRRKGQNSFLILGLLNTNTEPSNDTEANDDGDDLEDEEETWINVKQEDPRDKS